MSSGLGASFNIRSFGSNCSATATAAITSARSCFNIRSFGSNCSASPPASTTTSILSFNIRSFGSNCSACETRSSSRPNFRVSISALSDRIAQPTAAPPGRRLCWRFNIRSFGSNCSALSQRGQRRGGAMFQYPLFRIELLSSFITQTLQLKLEVSISALSDRIAQQRACFISTVASSVSISALSDRIAQPSRRRTWIG